VVVSFGHASVYDSPSNESLGLRVLIMRQWPRGIRKERIDVWLKDAAPSRELLDAHNHHGLAWDEFLRRYREEIKDERPGVLEELRRLEREHGRVTLLCFERIPPAEHCHRLVLLDLLASS
jgi:uncharacterized protein YeaO (DUF488 family)